MTITLLILLLITAFTLILVEIFVVPGVGIPGIAGLVLMVVCIYLGYTMSATIGNVTLGTAAIGSGILLIVSLNAKTWDRFSQKYSIKGKVEKHVEGLKAGDQGISMGRLNPMGKARFGETIVEVQSRGGYIDANGPVEIIKLDGNKIYVQLIKNS